MSPREPTAFEQRVYALVKQVPRGQVTTYKQLAKQLHCACCQAIGQALKRNPFAPDVPCHRVISSNLTVGGFKGESAGREISEKIQLLQSEGVLFDRRGKLADNTQLFTFS